MLSPSKKRSAGVALIFAGKGNGSPSEDEETYGPDEPSEDKDEDVGLESAADAVFDAIKKGDRKAFGEALHTYVSQCKAEES